MCPLSPAYHSFITLNFCHICLEISFFLPFSQISSRTMFTGNYKLCCVIVTLSTYPNDNIDTSENPFQNSKLYNISQTTDREHYKYSTHTLLASLKPELGVRLTTSPHLIYRQHHTHIIIKCDNILSNSWGQLHYTVRGILPPLVGQCPAIILHLAAA